MLNQKQIGELLDGSLEDRRNHVLGRYRGFYTVIQPTANGIYRVTMSAYQEQDPGNALLSGELSKLKLSNKSIRSAEVSGYSFYIEFAAMSAKKFIELVNETIPQITRFLTMNGYESGCSSCGSKFNVASYTVNGTVVFLCPECAAEIEKSLADNKEVQKTRKSDLVKGAVGALIGAFAGAVVYLLLYRIGFFAAISGMVMSVLALMLYEKFGGCLDIKGVICCIVILVLMVYFANRLSWAWDAYDALRDYGWSFSECFRELGYIVTESDLTGSYYGSLGLGYLFTALGSVRQFVSAFKGSTGSYTFKKN
ncbi:MAG: hypothetical protein IJM49_06110 [Firmicutes bacterium]|nr:hypothetical protein [Bacillota bacterium]MBR0481442.1 hypothetical protein [Bacillota bacterium]